MQLFSPNPTAMFLSWGRGAQTSAPPAKDAFREAFQSRLEARLPRETAAQAGKRLTSRPELDRGQIKAQGQQRLRHLKVDADSSESRGVQAGKLPKKHQQAQHLRRRPESQEAAAGSAAGQSQAVSHPATNPKGGAASPAPPQALQELIAFLQSQPDGSMVISVEQAPAVAAFLRSAGLPQEEVDGILSGSGSPEITLTAANLSAAWERAQAQGLAASGAQTPGPSPEPFLRRETPEIQQTSDYRALWERATLPPSMLPTLRLALAHLGASPEILAQVEEEAQGQGIPLARVWQLLPNIKPGSAAHASGAAMEAAPNATFSPSAQLGERPVTAAEMAEWRQVLLKANLQPEVVDKLLVQASPATQEELKTTLLAMAPAEEELPTLAEPKPLYLPQVLRLRPYFWQPQTGSDQPPLNGDGLEEQGTGANGEFPPWSTPALPQGTMSFPSFAGELQGLAQNLTSSGPALGDAGSAWRLLSPEARESLWSQVQSGVLTNLGQGESRVTLNLNPPELGQIQLTLHLSGQELAVTALATRPEVAEVANLGVQQLLQALAQQGLVLTQFQVRLQDQPERLLTPALAGVREKGNEAGGNPSASSRRRSREVDRFV